MKKEELIKREQIINFLDQCSEELIIKMIDEFAKKEKYEYCTLLVKYLESE